MLASPSVAASACTSKTNASSPYRLADGAMETQAVQATPVADKAFEPKCEKNNQANQLVATPKNAKTHQNEKPRKLHWEAINPATWRLVDPDGPKVETPRCHGHWPGYFTPKVVAWVFDVGIGRSDWRVRVAAFGLLSFVRVSGHEPKVAPL